MTTKLIFICKFTHNHLSCIGIPNQRFLHWVNSIFQCSSNNILIAKFVQRVSILKLTKDGIRIKANAFFSLVGKCASCSKP